MLKKGDQCYVRWQGEILKATYILESRIPRSYWVQTKKGHLCATSVPQEYDDCRFVCMTGLNKGTEK